MSAHHCECGYQAGNAADLTDHLLEAFTPEDDKDPAGQAHAEEARDISAARVSLTCLCGFTGTAAALDEHFLRTFIQDDQIGRDGACHARR